MDLEREERLVRAAQKSKGGPNLPFGELYKAYSPRIKGYFLSRLNDQTIADDLVSKTFEKALNGLDSFRWQGVPFSAWLFRIARNVFFDYLRSEKSSRKIRLDETAPTKSDLPTQFEELIESEEDSLLKKALTQIPTREQEIVYLKFYEGLTNREIARIKGISETNVGTIIYRTIQKLREKLTEG